MMHGLIRARPKQMQGMDAIYGYWINTDYENIYIWLFPCKNRHGRPSVFTIVDLLSFALRFKLFFSSLRRDMGVF
jgi:hypothetical protein